MKIEEAYELFEQHRHCVAWTHHGLRSGQVDNIDPSLLRRVLDDCNKLLEKK